MHTAANLWKYYYLIIIHCGCRADPAFASQNPNYHHPNHVSSSCRLLFGDWLLVCVSNMIHLVVTQNYILLSREHSLDIDWWSAHYRTSRFYNIKSLLGKLWWHLIPGTRFMLTFQVAFWCAFVHSTNYSVECSGSSFIDERRMYTQPLRLANCYEPLDLLQNHERQI